MALRYIERLHTGSVSAQRPCNWKKGKAIFALTERRYWKRIWIVQEIILAKDIIVFCGQMSVAWSCFSRLYEQLQNVYYYGRMEHIPFAWPVFKSAALRIVSKRLEWQSLPLGRIGLPIEDVLEDFADMESTELKDKVYALLGIMQPFVPDSSIGIPIDYLKTTTGVYRDVLRYIFYHKEGLGIPEKQRFKKLLRRSLGLGVINVIEREPVTEARILIDVERRAQTIAEKIISETVERFRSTVWPELLLSFQKEAAEIAKLQSDWLAWPLWINEYVVTRAIASTALEPELKTLLEAVVAKHFNGTINDIETKLMETVRSYLDASRELGIETTMRWVQESRFEVESDRDKILDLQMELRMMDSLETHIERHVNPLIQSATDSALQVAKRSTADLLRLTVLQYQASLNTSADEDWRRDYIGTWICKWERQEITYHTSVNKRATIEKWVNRWFNRQVKIIISPMSGTKLVKRYLTEVSQRYGNIDFGFPPYLKRSFDTDDEEVREIILRWIRERNGIFDPSSTDIEDKIIEFYIERYQSSSRCIPSDPIGHFVLF